MSRLEQERAEYKAKKALENENKQAETSEWVAKSLSDIFQNVQPRKSRLEREKEAAMENAKNGTDQEQVSMKKKAEVDSAIWDSVIKKRSRLEMEQDKLKE